MAQCDADKKMINPLVAENIDFKTPNEGQIIHRLREVAKERGILYTPSKEM